MQEIRISCTAHTTLPLDAFTDLQGNLKELKTEKYLKLKQSILSKGFRFPVFCWKDNDTYWIIDAHQRIRTLKKMRDEGYTIPDLPTDFIHAENKIDAKESILLQESRYGEMTDEGLYEFIHEPDAVIEIEQLEPILELPIDLDYENSPENGGTPTEEKLIICPSCGHKFSPS